MRGGLPTPVYEAGRRQGWIAGSTSSSSMALALKGAILIRAGLVQTSPCLFFTHPAKIERGLRTPPRNPRVGCAELSGINVAGGTE